MVVVGVLYLTFERSILKESGYSQDSMQPANNIGSRALIGAQVSPLISFSEVD